MAGCGGTERESISPGGNAPEVGKIPLKWGGYP